MNSKLTPQQEAARATWQYRAIENTRGNQTPLGCMVLAVIGKRASNPPFITGSASIDVDGIVWAPFTNKEGHHNVVARMCSVEELQYGFSMLADELKLHDADRVAMFTEVKKWILRDARAKSTLHFTAER